MKKVIDYSSREIIFYKFICNDPTIISTYVGHTINFTDRKYAHKSQCLNENSKEYNRFLYKTIRENGGWNNWTMFEIERKIVSSKQEALQHEQELINLQVEKLNINDTIKNINFLKIYYENNKPIILDKAKKFYQQKKDQIKINVKKYSEQNKEKISLQKKIYRDLNKEQISNKHKIWWNDNKEKINLLKREKYKAKKELNLMSKEDKYYS